MKKLLVILSVIYERLKEYKKELEVLDALKEQGLKLANHRNL